MLEWECDCVCVRMYIPDVLIIVYVEHSEYRESRDRGLCLLLLFTYIYYPAA